MNTTHRGSVKGRQKDPREMGLRLVGNKEMLLSQKPGRKETQKGPSQDGSVSERQQHLLKRARGSSWWLTLRRAFPQSGGWEAGCNGLKNKDKAEGCTSLNGQICRGRDCWGGCWASPNAISPDLYLCPFSHVSHHTL